MEMENGDLELTENTGYIKFELGIRDFGCGLSDMQIKKLFVDFNNLQEHSAQNPSGRGLGLSICKNIVEQMGGDVKVTSEIGKGSVFKIISRMMCLVEGEANHSNDAYSEECNFISDLLLAQVSNRDVVKKEFRVLIANDDPFQLFSYSEQLNVNFDVETAENGMQAVQLVASHDANYYNAIILDLNMPIMDGFEACAKIDRHLLGQR